MSNVEIEEDQPSEFSVQVKGDNSAKVEWSLNGALVKDGVNFQVSLTSQFDLKKMDLFLKIELNLDGESKSGKVCS